LGDALRGKVSPLAKHATVEIADGIASSPLEQARHKGVNEAREPTDDHCRGKTDGRDQMPAVTLTHTAGMREEQSVDHLALLRSRQYRREEPKMLGRYTTLAGQI
jgi:hypothetical protein